MKVAIEAMPIKSTNRANIMEPMARDNVLYYIANGKGEYWSNDLRGWSDIYEADQYTSFEKSILNLPMGGRWVKV